MTFEELVKHHSAEMIEKLVTRVLSESPIEIRFDYLEQDQWAMITMYEYEEDKEVSVRLHPGDRYELYFGYYDDEDEFFEITHDFTEEEKKILPEAFKKLMKKVLDDEQGIRISGSFLSR